MSTRLKVKRIPKRSVAGLRRRLMQRRSALVEELQDRLKEHEFGCGAPVADPGDMATSESDVQFVIMLSEAESRELAEVDDALARIDSGRYGWCEGCGKLVGLARLKALPFARLCLTCKRHEEHLVSTYRPRRANLSRALLYGLVDEEVDDDLEPDMQEIEAECVETEPADGAAGGS